MTRDEFMNYVYDELHDDGNNFRANCIIDAAEEYAESQSQELEILEDGTLNITVDDYSKVGRVLVQDGNNLGSLFYPEQEPTQPQHIECVGNKPDALENALETEDLISRQDTLKAMIKALGISGEKYLLPAEKALYDIVKAMPSVQPKHGEWYKPKTTVRPFGEDTIQCSECGFLTDIDSNYNYCPKCGSRMDSRFERGEI